jgi:hypothetical protein
LAWAQAALGPPLPWEWLKPLLGDFLRSVNDHQVHLATTFSKELEFCRFQVALAER